MYRDVNKSPIEDVDTTSYEINKELSSEETQEEGAWLCEIYAPASMQENIKMMENLELDEAYIPQPISNDRIDEHVWMKVLSTIDVSALSKGTRFCNELGYAIEPILMIAAKRDTNDEIEPLYWAKDEISIRNIFLASETGYQLDASSIENLSYSDNAPIVDLENLEKIKELLSHRKDKLGLECSRKRRLARKEQGKKQAWSKGIKNQPPVYRDQKRNICTK